MNEIVKLLLISLLAVAYLFVVSKFMGKKQIGQLEFIDYVIGISIGSISAEMAVDVTDTPFYYYIIAVTVFFLFDLMVSYLGRKGPLLKHFFKGRPQMIIYNGNIMFDALKKSKLDVNDVISMCREKGYFDITKVAFAVFETSGSLSVMPMERERQLKLEDLKKVDTNASLPFYLVIDGNISHSSLNELNKTTEWLYKKAKLDKKKIKNVLLACYDEENDKIKLQFKNK